MVMRKIRKMKLQKKNITELRKMGGKQRRRMYEKGGNEII